MKNPDNIDQEPESGYQRLEAQIKWYDTKSMSAQNIISGQKLLKFVLPHLSLLWPESM